MTTAKTTSTTTRKTTARKPAAPKAAAAAPVEPKAAETKTAATKAAEAAAKTTEKVVEQAVAVADETVAKANEVTTKVTENFKEAATKGYDQVKGFNQANIDAVVAAGTAYTKAVESLAKEMIAFSQNQMEDSMAATKAIMGAKTVKEVIDLQVDYAKSSIDTAVDQIVKMNDMQHDHAQEIAGPLKARAEAAVELATKPLTSMN